MKTYSGSLCVSEYLIDDFSTRILFTRYRLVMASNDLQFICMINGLIEARTSKHTPLMRSGRIWFGLFLVYASGVPGAS